METIEPIQTTVPTPAGEPAAEPPRFPMARIFSRIALVLCLAMLVSQLIPVALMYIPGYDVQAHSFLVGSLCTGLITLPLMLLITRRLPAQRPERRKLSAGIFIALVCISYGGMLLGNLVGIGVNLLLSPNSVSLISDVASATGTYIEMIAAFVILAPVCEELVFRKVLVDRVLPYGEWPAILFSGLCFGLFHGNLTQFFYTFLLGGILAYVYLRTGNILYTIGIHACINFLGGVLPLLLPAASVLSMLAGLAGLILFFGLMKRIRVAKNAAPGVYGAMFGNAGMILFFLVSAVFMALVAVALNHPELTEGLM